MSGTVFLAVVGALLAVILILTFMIAAVVFTSVKSRYYRESRRNCRAHSMTGMRVCVRERERKRERVAVCVFVGCFV